jgi:hypothetical protein
VLVVKLKLLLISTLVGVTAHIMLMVRGSRNFISIDSVFSLFLLITAFLYIILLHLRTYLTLVKIACIQVSIDIKNVDERVAICRLLHLLFLDVFSLNPERHLRVLA